MIARKPIEHALRHVIDPELGVNVMDLGLIYDICIDDHRVQVTMTMTTPGYPQLGSLVQRIKNTLHEAVPAVQSVEVELVWDPPWDPTRMSDLARQQLGLGRSTPS